MDRCELAYQYHKRGYSCAQSVAGAFADMLAREPEQLFAAAGGFGGGVGGSHAELCGAISGGLLVLGLLFPHTRGEDKPAKREAYALAKLFRQRFFETFSCTRCGDLLKARPGVSSRTAAAVRLGVTAHCDIMVVTAVELLEELLKQKHDRQTDAGEKR